LIPDDPGTLSMRMKDSWWVELRAKMLRPHFADMCGFILWYDDHLAAEELVPNAAPYQKVCTP
jgi:hypothetical protein